MRPLSFDREPLAGSRPSDWTARLVGPEQEVPVATSSSGRVPLLAALVAVEVGLAAVVVGSAHGTVATVAGAAVLLVVLAGIAVPWRGRPLARTLRNQWSFRRRAGRRPQPATGADDELAPVREWLPGVALVAAQDRRGEATTLVADGTAWLAVLGLESDDDVLAEGSPSLRLDDLYRLLSVDDIVLASVQVVVLTVPAPALLVASADSPALGAYAEHDVPAVRRTTIALRLDPERCAPAVAARGGGTRGVSRALRRCAEATAEMFSVVGHRWRWLDDDACREVLELYGGADAGRPDCTGETGLAGIRTTETRTTESWSSWRCDGYLHHSARVTRLPEPATAGVEAILAASAHAPALATSVAVTVRVEPPDRRTLDVVVRAWAPDDRAAAAALDVMSQAVSSSGVRLRRLDGEQAAGAIASLPLGGEVRV